MWRYFRAHPSKGPPAHGQTTTNLPVLPPTTPGRVPNPNSISCAHTYLASDVDLAPLGALRGRRSVNLAARTGVRNLECCAGLGGGGGGGGRPSLCGTLALCRDPNSRRVSPSLRTAHRSDRWRTMGGCCARGSRQERPRITHLNHFVFSRRRPFVNECQFPKKLGPNSLFAAGWSKFSSVLGINGHAGSTSGRGGPTGEATEDWEDGARRRR